ncbi:MAG: hypothetical protein E7321_08660 [Clostridiales bacterium]|nr:hypothetical protein [Clostridiales bacterium]
MKHTPSLILFSLLLTLFMLPVLAGAETLECIAPEGQYVNVRNRASSSAATWGILHAGDLIDANPAEIENGFFKTTYKDHDAYVSVKFFEIAVGADYTVSANGRVRMRKSPAGSASGFIQPGKRVHVFAWRYAGDGTKWARCAGGSYISADYLVPVL